MVVLSIFIKRSSSFFRFCCCCLSCWFCCCCCFLLRIWAPRGAAMLVLSSPMVKRLARDVSDTFTTHATLVHDVTNTHCRRQNGSAHGRVVATFKRGVSSLRFPFKFLRQRHLNTEEIRQLVSLLVFGCSPSCHSHGVISGRIRHSLTPAPNTN